MKLTALEKVQKAHIAIMTHEEFRQLAGIIMMGETTVEASERAGPFKTAATDGLNTIYHPEFVDKLNEKQLRFLILHENWHKAYRHLTTWGDLAKNDKERRLLGMAMDHAINLEIKSIDTKQEFVEMPPDGCCDPKYNGMSTPQIFRLLKEKHKEWLQQPEMQMSGKGGPGKEGDGQDFHDWAKAQGMTPKEQEALGREIDRALRQGGLQPGAKPGGLTRGLAELLEPKVDWKTELAEFVKSVCAGKDVSSWRKISRRWVSEDMYLPDLVGEAVGPVVISIDTSGSIGERELQAAASELVAVCKEVCPESVDVLWWDTEIAGHQSFKPEDFNGIEQKLKAAGGGGTDGSVAPKWIIKQKPRVFACHICITDGYVGSWGDPDGQPPTLWLITTDVVAPWGKTLRLDLD